MVLLGLLGVLLGLGMEMLALALWRKGETWTPSSKALGGDGDTQRP